CLGRPATRCHGSKATVRRRKARYPVRRRMSRAIAAAIARKPRRRTRKLLSLMLALASILCCQNASSAEVAGGGSEPAAAAPQPASSDTVHYRVVIDAPSEFTDVLRNSVDLVRWQSYEDMTGDLFDRLARDAVDQSREAVSTE